MCDDLAVGDMLRALWKASVQRNPKLSVVQDDNVAQMILNARTQEQEDAILESYVSARALVTTAPQESQTGRDAVAKPP